MKSTSLAPSAGTSLPAIATAAPAAETVVIKIGNHEVPVVKGGLYDRFRSRPPLSAIAAESPATDLSWFKGITKEKVNIGFESWSPNFYYENSRVTVIFTANLARLRELMPPKVLEQVQPLQVWPGRGVVALTAYAYHYCDNDSYNEIGLSVVTNKPGSSNWGPFSLMGQSFSDDFWGYVLKLPVDTELAKVRGVVGYNLPKWLTRIDYSEGDDNVVVNIFDSQTQALDITLQTRKLDVSSSKETTGDQQLHEHRPARAVDHRLHHLPPVAPRQYVQRGRREANADGRQPLALHCFAGAGKDAQVRVRARLSGGAVRAQAAQIRRQALTAVVQKPGESV